VTADHSFIRNSFIDLFIHSTQENVWFRNSHITLLKVEARKLQVKCFCDLFVEFYLLVYSTHETLAGNDFTHL